MVEAANGTTEPRGPKCADCGLAHKRSYMWRVWKELCKEMEKSDMLREEF